MSRWTPERALCWWRRQTTRAVSLWVGPQGVWSLPEDQARWPDFDSWCRAHPGARVRLFLSSAWLTVHSSDPTLALRRPQALLDHARTQLVQFHGEAARDWPLLSWQLGEVRGACAVQGDRLQALQATARSHGVHLQCVEPGWLAASSAVRPAEASASSLFDEGELATVVDATEARIRRRPTGQSWTEWLATEPGGDQPEAMTRISLPSSLSAAAAQARPRHDYLAAARPQHLPALAALTAVLVLVTAAWDARQAWLRQQESSVALEQALVKSAAAVAPAAPMQDGPESQRRTALQRPWQAIFVGAEAAAGPGLQWALMDASNQDLRLEGWAPDMAHAWRAAHRLERQPGVQQAAVSHVQADGDQVRFVLRAAWARGGATP